MATRCKFRGRRGILRDVLKNDGGLARNIDFEVPNFTGDVFGRPFCESAEAKPGF